MPEFPALSPRDLNQLTIDLLPTIIEAGALIMEVYETDFTVEFKGDQSPVTVADERAEELITKALKARAPDIQIIGEEAMSAEGAPIALDDVYWLVDPLDGTKEFIKKGEDFTVNIGLISDGRPILGLVFAPALGKLYWGSEGNGACLATVADGKITAKRRINYRASKADRMVIVASKSHRSPELETWLSHFPSADHVSIGSSLKFCLLAEGAADLYPRLGPTCEWDTGAAHAILLAAGGDVLDVEGGQKSYGKDPVKFLNGWFLCRADVSQAVPSLK